MNELVLGEIIAIHTTIIAFVASKWTISGMNAFVLLEWTAL